MNTNSSEVNVVDTTNVPTITKSIIDSSVKDDIEICLDRVQSNFLFAGKQPPNLAKSFVPVLINENKRLKNTRMCKFVIEKGSCPRVSCNFAHTITDLEPVECIFDGNCSYKENNCTYFHKGETMEEYIIKIGYKNLLEKPCEIMYKRKDYDCNKEVFLECITKMIDIGKKNIRVIIE